LTFYSFEIKAYLVLLKNAFKRKQEEGLPPPYTLYPLFGHLKMKILLSSDSDVIVLYFIKFFCLAAIFVILQE